jgi:tetratricopeptide (TPR) repeat protein
MRNGLISILSMVAGLWASSAFAQMSDDAVKCTTERGEIAACTRAIESGTNTGQDLGYVYWARGINYDVGGDYDHAIDDFNHAIALGLGDGYHYFERGLLLEKMGRHSEAIADFRKCASLPSQRVCVDILKKFGATDHR